MAFGRKTLLGTALVLALLLTVLSTAVFAADANPFSDVKETDWYYDAVQYVNNQGLMQGTGSGIFSPNLATSRGMIVAILYRLDGATVATDDCPFADVAAGSYYRQAVIWAYQNRIVEGYSNDAFGPDDAITREQLAAILYRYMQYRGMDAVTTEENLSGFADAGAISQYAVSALNWAVGQGLIGGMGDGNLNPQGYALRGQVALILQRLQDLLPEEAVSEYTVIFDLNYDDGGIYKKVTVQAGETVSAPAEPKREDYNFRGWYTKTSGGVKFDFDDGITADITLYAHWSKTGSSGGSGSSGGHIHNFVGEVTTEATCTEDGVRTYTCSICGISYEQPIPSLGHDYGDFHWDGVQEDSTHSRSCSRCDATQQQACVFTDTPTVITVDGGELNATIHTCDVCGYTYTTLDDPLTDVIAVVDGMGYGNLEDAFTAAVAGGKLVTLVSDVPVGAKLTVPAGITLDGGGYTLQANNSSWDNTNDGKHLLSVEGASEATVVKNLVLDNNNQAQGMLAYESENVTLEQITIKNSKGIGLTVNDSQVTASGLQIAGSRTGSVNVDKGDAHFTLISGNLADPLQIWSELQDLDAVEAAGYHAYAVSGFYIWSQATVDQILAQAGLPITQLTLLTDQTVDGDLTVPEDVKLIVADGVELTVNGDISGKIYDKTDAQLIFSASQLREFAAAVNQADKSYQGKTVRLMADIDLSGQDWTPLDGWDGNLNQWHLDGNDHTISGMTIVGTGSLGFVGSNASDFTISDLTFDQATINGSGSFIGTVVGYQYGTVTLNNVDVTNSRIETSIANRGIRIGGLVGFSLLHDGAKLYLTDCDVANCLITGYHNACGLVGTMFNLYSEANWSMSNCSVTDCQFHIGTTTEKYVGPFTVNGGGTDTGDNGYRERAANDAYFMTVDDHIDVANRESGNTFTYGMAEDAQLEAADSQQLASFATREGAEVFLTANTYTLPETIADGVTIRGAGNDSLVNAETMYELSANGVTLQQIKVDGGGEGTSIQLKGKNTLIADSTFVNGGGGTWDAHIDVCIPDGKTATIRNCHISGAFRAIIVHNGNVKVENCTLDGVYPINVNSSDDLQLEVEDTILNGWTSLGSIESASFTDCTFGKETMYGQYAHFRPYAPTTLTRCEFSSDMTIDCGEVSDVTFTFNDCTRNGVELTAETLKEMFSEDSMTDIQANTWIVNGETVEFE